MPLPSHALTLCGGCNCRSIRYRINVPPLSERPVAPYHTPTAPPEVIGTMPRVPCVLLDHCNDCRRATSSVIPMCLVTDTKTVEISFLSFSTSNPASASNGSGKAGAERDDDREWLPLEPILDAYESESHFPAGSKLASTHPNSLGHYSSSTDRHRWFCAKCGTPLAYSVTYAAYPEAWRSGSTPRMFDVWLGTLDRADLQNEWMRPDHAVWCAFGIPWVSDFARVGARRLVEGAGASMEPVPRHPLFMADQAEGDDVSAWLDGMRKS